MQTDPIYRNDDEVYVKDEGKGQKMLYVEEVREARKYTLRRGDTTGMGVVKDDVRKDKDKVFAEQDLSEEPLDQEYVQALCRDISDLTQALGDLDRDTTQKIQPCGLLGNYGRRIDTAKALKWSTIEWQEAYLTPHIVLEEL